MVKTIWGYNVEALSSGIDKRKMGSKETKQKKRKKTPENRREWKETGVREKDLTGELCVRALFT